MDILERNFYRRSSIQVSKELLGKLLVRKNDNGLLIGKIVEVEAYMGTIDKAAHSYGGKITKRNKVMYGDAGYAYVYMIYGMYYCMNVVTSCINNPEAVLIRAVEPLYGLEDMSKFRYGREFNALTKKEIINLTNGPGKLCKAMNINKENNEENLCSDELFIAEDPNRQDFDIVESKRINIDYAEEAKDFLWRFYIKDNPYVSKK